MLNEPLAPPFYLRGIDFWTQNQTVTSLWRSEDALSSKADVVMPTHH
jgi:malonate-semialdehyde dehydrogenase (acetylating)/methylmalonate-semialdehyde dehydrogenase